MKKMFRMSAGLVLGSLLCLGILLTPQVAEAAYWYCPNHGYIWCPDVIYSNGVRYCNTSAWCNFPNPGQFTCWYSHC